MSRIRTLRGALLEAHREIGKLRIVHPDPDAYDKGFNEAVDRALQTIEVVAGRLAESRALRERTLLALRVATEHDVGHPRRRGKQK